MQSKSVSALAVTLVLACSADHLFATPPVDPIAETSCEIPAAAVSVTIPGQQPEPQSKASCPAPYCVTHADCINRPIGDPYSTCEYGRGMPTPPGCGYCYY